MSIVDSVKQFVRRKQFEPGIAGMFVNPFYFARKGLYRHIREFAPQMSGTVLDVGCGRKPYERLFHVDRYIGLEFYPKQNSSYDRADVYYDGKRFPFRNEEFDNGFASEVFEHIFNPLEFLSELNRVVKINGLVLMTVPFLWPEHMQPLDFGRYTSFGLRAVLEQHGFEILHQRKSMTGIRAIIQLWNVYLYRKTETRSGVFNFLFCVVLIAPGNLLGELVSILLPDNEEIYLDTVILARKIKNL